MGGPRVSFTPTSFEQLDELAAYAIVKGHRDLASYALYAAVTMMGKNPLTDAQKVKAEQIIKERQKARQL